jgi:hypothetical protein
LFSELFNLLNSEFVGQFVVFWQIINIM